MSSTESPTGQPAARYPVLREQPPRSRSLVRIALVVVVVALGVLIAYVGYRKFAGTDLNSEVTGFKVVNQSTGNVQFSLTRDHPDRPAVCIVRVRSRDGAETGRREVLIPPSHDSTVQFETDVRTSASPGMGDVYGCGYKVPDYLKVG